MRTAWSWSGLKHMLHICEYINVLQNHGIIHSELLSINLDFPVPFFLFFFPLRRVIVQ